MKMSAEHYSELEVSIHAKLESTPNLWRNYRGQGLSPMRFRWDVLHACFASTSFLYDAGLNDDHIDTALRKICKPYMV